MIDEPEMLGAEGRGESQEPRYAELHRRGLLHDRARILDEVLSCCTLCPRQCRVDRRSGHLGACGVDHRPKIAAFNIHPWEEPPISGMRGSGTIFFSGCTLSCVYCQNYPISQLGVGRSMSTEDLAEGMLKLQRRGAHNINLVTATHQMPAVVGALVLAIPQGFRLPLVYNTSGYERKEILEYFEGIIDVYLPDIKYADSNAARFCSGRADYVKYNRLALLEMWRQVGPLRVDSQGLAQRGMLVRHLVLPEDLSGSRRSLAFLAEKMGPGVWVSLMNQYFPAYKAHNISGLSRKVTAEEYEQTFSSLAELGLEWGFAQEFPEESLPSHSFSLPP